MKKHQTRRQTKRLSRKRIGSIISKFPRSTVAIIGDLMVDHYVYGAVERISPEAPVPVLLASREDYMLGGAANVLRNVLSFGSKARLFGVIGEDQTGRLFKKRLGDMNTATDGVICVKNRKTTLKTRFVSKSQQILRVDNEASQKIDKKTADILLRKFDRATGEIDILIISDYNKGVITPYLMESILTMMKEKEIRIIVDPRPDNINLYKGVSLLTPNLAESEQATRTKAKNRDDVVKIASNLLSFLSAEAIIITMGGEGSLLLETGQRETFIPALPVEVFDGTGAGDTSAAAVAVSLAAGANYLEAASIANIAGGIVVTKWGTSTVSRAELIRRDYLQAILKGGSR